MVRNRSMPPGTVIPEVPYPPTDYPYGERQYSTEDPAGHTWTFSQTIKDVNPAEWGGEPLDAT
jgi:hypothetical protein